MAISPGQSVAAHSSGSANTLTSPGINVAASGSVIDVFCWADAPLNTPTDNKGNAYTAVTAQTTNSGINARKYRCENATGGTGLQVTFTTGFSSNLSMTVQEILGALTSGALDQQVSAVDSSSPFTATTGTTTQSAELSCASMAGNSGSTPATHAESTGYTIQSEVTTGGPDWPGCTATKVLSATGAQTPSFTELSGSTAGVHVATYKEASGGGGGAMIGTTSMSFSSASTLGGKGALAGATAITVSQTGTLRGSGALAGSSVLAFASSATLRGAGALAGTTQLQFTPSGVLLGTGALSGQSAITFSVTGSLTPPSGSMSSTTAIALSSTSSLRGAGALAGTLQMQFASNSLLQAYVPIAGEIALRLSSSALLLDANGVPVIDTRRLVRARSSVRLVSAAHPTRLAVARPRLH